MFSLITRVSVQNGIQKFINVMWYWSWVNLLLTNVSNQHESISHINKADGEDVWTCNTSLYAQSHVNIVYFKGDKSAQLYIIELLSSRGVDMWDGLVVTLSNTWLSSWYSFSSTRRSHERKHCAHDNDFCYQLNKP